MIPRQPRPKSFRRPKPTNLQIQLRQLHHTASLIFALSPRQPFSLRTSHFHRHFFTYSSTPRFPVWQLDARTANCLECLMHNAARLLVATLFVTAVQAAESTPALEVIHLWPNGAPGFEDRRHEPEEAASYWVKNVHNPSITVFLPPREKATGAAVVICPGGGFRELGFNGEGIAPARFMTNLGVAAFALKYRLPRQAGSPYKLPDHPKEDIQRALRLIRSRAQEWGIDTNRIGVMGFSAGGEVASLASYTAGDGSSDASDPIDRFPANVNFQIMIYPGPLGLPDVVDRKS